MGTLVETTAGSVEGREEGGLAVFRGIPYARPPLGALRFRAPEPPEPWPGVREAHEFGPGAPQNAGMTGRMLGIEIEPSREDCLTLNVWTPAADAERRPVLVWLHGGSFATGATRWFVYDGAALARRGDAVVVTVNYRLGALGWLPVPHEEGVGNFGLLDQVAALEWVRDNAARFGGDPSNVTLFGESAGAMSVGALLAAARARGLFRRAILQSGAADNVHDRADAERVSDAFARELGVRKDDLPALRAAEVGDLLGAQARARASLARVLPRLALQPVVDGRVLARPPAEALSLGEADAVPLLVGSNLDEWKLYALGDPKSRQLDDAGLQRRFERGLPGRDAQGRLLARRVIDHYREAREGRASTDPAELWFAIQSDRWFRHPAMRLAETNARREPATFAYLFDWASPALGGTLGSCHTLDVPFVLGSAGHERIRPLVGEGPEVERLSARMQDAWLSFARTGDPSTPELAWPAYDASRRATMRLGRRCEVEDAPLERERAFWDEIG